MIRSVDSVASGAAARAAESKGRQNDRQSQFLS